MEFKPTTFQANDGTFTYDLQFVKAGQAISCWMVYRSKSIADRQFTLNENGEWVSIYSGNRQMRFLTSDVAIQYLVDNPPQK